MITARRIIARCASALNDPSPTLRRDAIDTLANTPVRQSVDILVTALEHPTYDVREHAQYCLFRDARLLTLLDWRRRSSWEPFVRGLDSHAVDAELVPSRFTGRNLRVGYRLLALWALRFASSRPAVEALSGASVSANVDEQLAAIASLLRITSRDALSSIVAFWSTSMGLTEWRARWVTSPWDVAELCRLNEETRITRWTDSPLENGPKPEIVERAFWRDTVHEPFSYHAALDVFSETVEALVIDRWNIGASGLVDMLNTRSRTETGLLELAVCAVLCRMAQAGSLPTDRSFREALSRSLAALCEDQCTQWELTTGPFIRCQAALCLADIGDGRAPAYLGELVSDNARYWKVADGVEDTPAAAAEWVRSDVLPGSRYHSPDLQRRFEAIPIPTKSERSPFDDSPGEEVDGRSC